MTSLSRRIGKNVRAARLTAGLTQQELATKAGVSVVHISRLERAQADQPRRAELEDVATALGKSVDDLMGIDDEAETPDGDDDSALVDARRELIRASDDPEMTVDYLWINEHRDRIPADSISLVKLALKAARRSAAAGAEDAEIQPE